MRVVEPAAVGLLLALVIPPAGADDAPPPAGDPTLTVGATCPRLRPECADGRIATRWVLDSFARDLPSGRSVWALLETVEPAAVVDRIDGAGLHLDEPGRYGMRGASWAQNSVLLDGVEVTDPLRGGTPLFLPDVDTLRSIEVTSALAPADYGAPGVTLALASLAPATSWQGTVQGYGLAPALQSAEPGPPPSIARFASLADASALVTGPVAGGRFGLLASGRLARVRRLERSDPAVLEARLVSGLLRLECRAGEQDTVRLGGAAQALERPLAARARFPSEPVTERADAEALARAGVDVLALDDDVGMPRRMMISPRTWREFFAPRLADVIRAARAVKTDLRVLYHSDGHIEPILGDLVEIGVDAINPVQPEHMDAVRIRRRFGPRLALWGTVGRQTTFAFATPSEIRAEVEERVATLGRAGLVLCPAYDVDEPDVPWENVAAFLQAAAEFGQGLAGERR